MADKIVVTDAQVKAAQMIVDYDRATGRKTDEATRKIAEAQPEHVVDNRSPAAPSPGDYFSSPLATAAKLGEPRSSGGGKSVLKRGKSGKFVLKRGKSGKFYFNLLTDNGQIIATSETYESKEAALEGIKSVETSRDASIETEA